MVSCLPSFPPFNLHTPWSDSDIWLSYDQQDVRDKHLWAQERIPPRVNNGLITWPIRGNQKTPWNAHNRPRCHSNSMKRERKRGQCFLRTCGYSVNNFLLLTSFPSRRWNTLRDEGYFPQQKGTYLIFHLRPVAEEHCRRYLVAARKRQNNLEEPDYRAWTLQEAVTVESIDCILLKELTAAFWW